MGDNLSDGAKIAAIFVTLIAVLTIVFSMIATIKHLAASQSQSLQNTLTKLSSTEFTNYEQKTVSGADVDAALKIFEGRNVAIVVATQADIKAAGASATKYSACLYGVKLTGEDSHTPAVDASRTAKNSGPIITIDVELSNSGNETNYTDTTKGIVKYTGNSYYTAQLYTNTSGATEFNMNARPMQASGRRTYVRSGANFFAEVIKDPTGDTIGIFFLQLN